MVFTDTTMYLKFILKSIYASLSEDKLLEAVHIAMYANYFLATGTLYCTSLLEMTDSK